MSKNIETAYTAIQILVKKFAAHEAAYLSSDFVEASLRQEFLDDFLVALGWDVAGKNHTNPYEREVRVEKNVSVGHAKKKADYAFYIAPNFRDVRFYIEAKRPTLNLATKDNYFQAARYGWNSSTPLAVLTDFRELHLIDCRYQPDIDSILETGKTPYRYHYSEFSNREKFAEIYWLISREAVVDGSLEKRSEELPKKRGKAVQRGLFKGGYQSIDDAFIEDLEEMRDELARGLKNGNSNLDGETLTEVTQRILDRLVFLRFLEDKLIETHEKVSNFGNSGSVWIDFLSASHRLDIRYNGVVFKPHKLIDDPKLLNVDEGMFGKICERLADINSPYDFNAIPIHILGSIYERFLGKVIVATEKRAKLVEKPDVRKAGGVYYTPEYIVRNICEKTIGLQIAGKTPKEISEMKFIDISCGSGSFLLGIFDVLIRYHTSWYNAQSKKERTKFAKSECVENEDGTLHVSFTKRREILINNIFGVDIDNQATEVAQLSLYLKLLEEETTATARNYQLEMGIALLPSLNKNIVCGNSLIESDILETENGELFEISDEEKRALNPMDFHYVFRDIFKKRGGFDSIVGNPPYVRPHKMEAVVKEYLWKKLDTFRAKSDLYSCFMERAVDLARPENGCVSFIVPHTWISLESFESIRKKLSEETVVNSLTQLPKKVFRDATVETCIFFVIKSDKKSIASNLVKVLALDNQGNSRTVKTYKQSEIEKTHLHNFQLYSADGSQQLLKKLTESGPALGEIVEFAYGFKTADDGKFLSVTQSTSSHKPFIRSAAIRRYAHDEPNEFVWYRPDLMIKNRKTARPGEAARFESEKIIVGRMGKSLVASYDEGGLYVKDAMLLLPMENVEVSLKAILALLNSRLIGFLYREFFITIDVLKNALLGLPLPAAITGGVKSDLLPKLEKLASEMMLSQIRIKDVKTDRDEQFYQTRIDQINSKIDEIVYELYGLSESEIALITD